MSDYLFGSLTRTGWLADADFEVHPLPRDRWGEGDFVVAEVAHRVGRLARVELPTGRLVEITGGDRIVGCLGTRAATLDYVGSYRDVRDDGHLDMMTSGGVFGRVVSQSPVRPSPVHLQYLGHALIAGRPANLADFALEDLGGGVRVPIALIIGTSMEAGKTLVARTLIRRGVRAGGRICGTKLSGVGRLKDIQTMSDAGATNVFDFVDAGLPSTVTDPKRVAKMVETIFSHIDPSDCDLCVVEAGASPLEPYNGDVVYECLRPHIAFTVLCAMDPYAVAGVRDAFGFDPDIVAGRAAGTSAARELVARLTGRLAVDVLDPDQLGPIDDLLLRCGIGTE